MITENETEQTEAAKGWLKTWLQSLGMSQTWANIITAALVGAATAVYALMQTSCGIAGITSTATSTTIKGTDGSTAVITPSTFTWAQTQPKAALPATGEIITITNDGK